MKYLLVLAVVWVAYSIWRKNHMRPPVPPKAAAPSQAKAGVPVVMVACLHCGTHLPEDEAVHGRGGPYCSAEHRQQHEGGSARPGGA
ncbi:MAG: hypothetical protein RLZZ352_2066 [Pseudomonadota bacterium]|jgi:uncharacterized protein